MTADATADGTHRTTAPTSEPPTGDRPRRHNLLGYLGILFGVLDKGDPLYAIGVAPEFVWELALGVYLTATGGRVAGLLDDVAAPAAANTSERRDDLVATGG